ncbi:hypothetical protein [Bacillus sp. REN3]|uniref:hypothetical protein n=1 Tax=Bacillus sp. REN3 TaxID=2802440 RepID=UPI001AED7C25|nr:hypothetical protein [Bacillus sp. REN3]
MKDEFINFYRKELGVWNLVYRYMNRWLLGSYILAFLGLIITSLVLLFSQASLLVVFLFFLLLIIEGFILNFHNKKIIEERYKISKRDQGTTWGGPLFSKMKSEKLESYVVKKLDSKEQLEKLIVILYKEAERRKFSGIFVRGLGLGLFLPLWNYFMKWVFGNELTEVNTAIALFIIMVILIGLIVFIISIIKVILLDYFDRESTRINELVNMLEDISLKPLNFHNKIKH